MKKLLLLIPVLVLFAGGCETKTLSAEDFLYAYRSGGMVGENSSPGASRYMGQQGGYHVVLITGGAPAMTFINENGRKIQCPVRDLPSDFPRGFVTLGSGEGLFETSEDTREYVREYLSRHSQDKTKPPPAKQEEDDWGTAK